MHLRLTGLQTFFVIWFGQLVSTTGSGMTRFALLIWAYQQTGNATTLALLGFVSFICYVPLSPIAGVWVDRLDRRVVMLLADGGAGILTAILLLLFATDSLQLWHVFVYEGVTGALDAFQTPAYVAATSTLIPPERRARINGVRSMAFAFKHIFSPLFGGLVLSAFGLGAVMGIDLLTFAAAYVTLLIVRVPKPDRSAEAVARPSVRREIREAFTYIRARPDLFTLFLIFSVMSFIASLTYLSIMPAMILARPGGGEEVLTAVRSVMGAAGMLGAITVVLLPKRIRLLHRIFICGMISFLGGDALMGIGQSLPVWLIAAVVTEFFIPIMMNAERTIIQNRTPDAMQGRVFALEGMVRDASIPIGYLLAGPLADRVFEPAMQPGGALAGIFGGIVGTGAGAGMGVMYLFTAAAGALLCLSAYLIPALKTVDLKTLEDGSQGEKSVTISVAN